MNLVFLSFLHPSPVHFLRPVNHQTYGEIETAPIITKRSEDDIEEALRKEEERMNKKLSHTAPVGSVHIGGLAGNNNNQGGLVSPRYRYFAYYPCFLDSNF